MAPHPTEGHPTPGTEPRPTIAMAEAERSASATTDTIPILARVPLLNVSDSPDDHPQQNRRTMDKASLDDDDMRSDDMRSIAEMDAFSPCGIPVKTKAALGVMMLFIAVASFLLGRVSVLCTVEGTWKLEPPAPTAPEAPAWNGTSVNLATTGSDIALPPAVSNPSPATSNPSPVASKPSPVASNSSWASSPEKTTTVPKTQTGVLWETYQTPPPAGPPATLNNEPRPEGLATSNPAANIAEATNASPRPTVDQPVATSDTNYQTGLPNVPPAGVQNLPDHQGLPVSPSGNPPAAASASMSVPSNVPSPWSTSPAPTIRNVATAYGTSPTAVAPSAAQAALGNGLPQTTVTTPPTSPIATPWPGAHVPAPTNVAPRVDIAPAANVAARANITPIQTPPPNYPAGPAYGSPPSQPMAVHTNIPMSSPASPPIRTANAAYSAAHMNRGTPYPTTGQLATPGNTYPTQQPGTSPLGVAPTTPPSAGNVYLRGTIEKPTDSATPNVNQTSNASPSGQTPESRSELFGNGLFNRQFAP